MLPVTKEGFDPYHAFPPSFLKPLASPTVCLEKRRVWPQVLSSEGQMWPCPLPRSPYRAVLAGLKSFRGKGRTLGCVEAVHGLHGRFPDLSSKDSDVVAVSVAVGGAASGQEPSCYHVIAAVLAPPHSGMQAGTGCLLMSHRTAQFMSAAPCGAAG